MRILIACLMAGFVSACATSGGVDTKCLTERPMRLTDAEIDALSADTARKILAYNEDGRRRCGWTPGKSPS